MSFILTHNDGGSQRQLPFLFFLLHLVGSGSLNVVTYANPLLTNGIPGMANPWWEVVRHAHKEVAFLYSILHKAFVVNEWRGKSPV